MRRALWLAALVVVSLPLKPSVITLADFTGDGSVHQVSTTAIRAAWVQFFAQSGNSGTCRVGDSSTSTTRGIPLGAGAGMMFPVSSGPYALSGLSFVCASSDKLTVTYGD